MSENHGNKKEPSCDTEPSEGEIGKANKCGTAPNNHTKCTDKPGWDGWFRNPEYVFAGAIAVFTLFLTLSAVYQYCAMRETNRINREALVSVQRAFVFPKPQPAGAIIDSKGDITLLSFAVDWENSGTTPTKDLTINIDSKAFNAQPVGDMFLDNKRNLDVPLIIGPKATISSDATRVFGEDLKSVREGKKFLFVWGRAKYRDIFTDTAIHRTRFVYEVSWNNQAGAFMSMHHSKFNCADEECNRQEQESSINRSSYPTNMPYETR